MGEVKGKVILYGLGDSERCGWERFDIWQAHRLWGHDAVTEKMQMQKDQMKCTSLSI